MPQPPSGARPYRGATPQERDAARRERLLESAFEAFGTQGYQQTTMRLICAEARLAERHFHAHFESLHAVYTEVYMRSAAAVGQAVQAARLQHQGREPIEISRAGVRAFLEFIQRDPRHARILLLDSLLTGVASPRNVKMRIGAFMPIYRQRLQQEFPQLDLDLDMGLVAGGLVGMVIHVATLWVDEDFATPIDKILDHLMYAWRGLGLWLGEHNCPPPS